ncbi:hypothetical protein BGW38_003207 [Lunasporangiospora selenospora]|uniref:K Homology domain-containing protein n=1 Tax=Lunasporangiospora selenospora TaxID=979761 RepID=A0A9P6G584_9FUNG|nr:hypothetical protein BGW38_003207 [Lunasporangiospora selenospora]
MSEEPRRKRKWDNAGEPEVDGKKIALETDASSEPGNEGPSAPTDAAATSAVAAAAIAAAKLNAMMAAKATSGPAEETNTDLAEAAPGDSASNGVSKENKDRDALFIDIDINDVKNRHILIKGPIQSQASRRFWFSSLHHHLWSLERMIQRETNAGVTTRGIYYQDRSLATEKDPPLYLHVSALTQEALDLAVSRVNELIEGDGQASAALPPQQQAFQPHSRMPHGHGHGHGHGPPRHYGFHDRVEIGMESDRMFNVRAKIVGPGGQYVKHVQNETHTRVQLKGRGSGYLEVESGQEADESLYINILGKTQEDVDEAVRLCKELVETIKAEYDRMKSRPPMQQEHYGHGRQYGNRTGYYGDRSHHHHNQRHHGGSGQYQHQQSHYGFNQSYNAPPPPPGVSAAPSAAPGAVTAPGTSAPATSAGTDPSAYNYDYNAYSQYYYQQQYYQQYSQYYQQYDQYYQQYGQAPPGTEGAAAPAAAGSAPPSSDPALAYYGFGYAPQSGAPSGASTAAQPQPPPPPPSSGAQGSESDSPPPPPPPPPPASAVLASLSAPGASDSIPPPPPPPGL